MRLFPGRILGQYLRYNNLLGFLGSSVHNIEYYLYVLFCSLLYIILNIICVLFCSLLYIILNIICVSYYFVVFCT